MIAVVSFDTAGARIDEAEAASPEAALAAGRTLYDDAVHARRIWGFEPSLGFYVGGSLVRLVQGRP